VAPQLLGVSAASNNASVRLHFSQFVDTVTIDPVDSFYFQAIPDPNYKRRKSTERRKRSFVSYRIYRASVPAGQPLVRTGPTATPFTAVGEGYVLDSVSISDTDPTLDLLNNDYYYYLVNTSTCDSIESLPSDTLKVMRVSVRNLQTPQMGMGVSWDTMTVFQGIPFPSFSNGDFIVERNFSRTPGVWQILDTIRSWNYSDVVLNVSDSINYRVGLINSTGVNFYSSIDGGVFWATSTSDFGHSPGVKVFPNPSNGIFKVEGSVDLFQVTDLNGRLIIDGEAFSGLKEIDLSKEPKGYYLLNLKLKNGTFQNLKLVKE
jgi:hypothetical protein